MFSNQSIFRFKKIVEFGVQIQRPWKKCSRFPPVPGSVASPIVPPLKKSTICMLSEAFESHRVPFACYLKHWSEPQPSTCTLFATFESHMRSTFDLRAVHIVTSCIYMPLVYLVYLSTSHSDSLHYSSFAYDWRITNTVSIHITYIVLIAYLYNTYVLFIYIYSIIYLHSCAASKTTRTPVPHHRGEEATTYST